MANPNPNTSGLKPFVKGDKKINRLGRPKNFDQVRKLAQKIAAESLEGAEAISRIEALLRVMTTSRNPADRKTFLEYAYGKPKEEVVVGGEGKIEIVITHEDTHKTTDTA